MAVGSKDQHTSSRPVALRPACERNAGEAVTSGPKQASPRIRKEREEFEDTEGFTACPEAWLLGKREMESDGEVPRGQLGVGTSCGHRPNKAKGIMRLALIV